MTERRRDKASAAAPGLVDEPRTVDVTTTPRVFDAPSYADITVARRQHLESLNLPIERKSVVDLGSGIGRFAPVFLSRGCRLLCVDAREENLRELRRLYPDVEARQQDVDGDSLRGLGTFDVVFAYGLLYHLTDPLRFLLAAAGICRELLILESCVCDAAEPLVKLVPENPRNVSQSLAGWGSRPSPAYIVRGLRLAGFEHVYEPRSLPDHPEFRYERRNDYCDLRDGLLIRTIFVASRKPIDSSALRRVVSS